MSFSDFTADLWSKMTTSGALKRCPEESELLAYHEGRLSDRKSEGLESHFVSCDECRESLTLFARVSSDQTDFEPVTGEEIKRQTASVIAFIKQDEVNRNLNPRSTRKRKFAQQWQLAAAAVVATVVIAAGVWVFVPSSESAQAMELIALAMKDERQLEPRLSGGIEWSYYPRTRGPETSPKEAQMRLEHAQSRLSFAKNSSAPAEARLTLARAYLATGTQDGAERALVILRELESSGNLSAEVLNDTGVALLQLENYDEAISYFSKALENRSDFNESLFNRALAEYKAGHDNESRRDWQEFIQKSPDSGWKQEAQDYLDQLDASR